jgi:tetratricopeptide (TPR) repeat protein
MRRTALLIAAFTGGCFSAPAPHPRAVDDNNNCVQYTKEGDLAKAEIYCDHGLEFSPFWADLWVNKGVIYLRRGQDDKAKECFIKALRYNQEEAQAYNDLGYIYLKDGAFGKAHDNFVRALKVNPDYTEARYNLALTYMKMADKVSARKEYRTIIAVNSSLADPHHDLCLMALEDGANEEAIDECGKAVQLDPRYDDAWLNLGNAQSEAGKYSEAKEAYQSCIEANEKNAQCRSNLAIVARKAALLDPALKEIKDTQSAENSAPAMYALARTLRDKGLKNEEERTYKKCLKLDPKYPPCHYGLYEDFSEERRDKEATIACKNFLKFAVVDEFPKEVETCERYLKSTE